jgi:putative transposase
VLSVLGVSERRACRTLGQPRSTQRKARVVRADEAALTDAVVSLAAKYGRYGYRRITALLRAEGWRVNAKRVERIWRREGLKVPRRQPKRGRLWLNDGSCVRLRPCWPGHVWAYDFVQDRTHDGRRFRMLTVIDEYTRECLAIVVARRLSSDDVLAALTELFVEHGPPDHIRSDNGPEFVAKVVRGWLGQVGVERTPFRPDTRRNLRA